MIRFLLARPIAVSMIFIALMVFSILTFKLLPISLLPPIDVPQIIVKVKYPNAAPEAIEQNVMSPIRSQLLTLSGLKHLESKSGSESGILRLHFEYGTPMNLAYIEVNEKIDRLTNSLPKDLERPQVVRVNTNDIPVVRIQVIPSEDLDFYEVSLLAENILKKRIEQISGVSLVDINGSRHRTIEVIPNKSSLQALGLTENDVLKVISQGNEDFPGISVADGQYRYYLRLASRVEAPEDILKLPVLNTEGMPIPLARVADVKYALNEPLGYHFYKDNQALVLTVHKQASAKMNEMVPEIYAAVDQFKLDYPEAGFELTQDQSLLLNAGIDNLKSSLLFGGMFAFGILFLFMGNYRTPLAIGISLPSSLLISFLVFYAFNISINIISLSGLALGLGMMIDNSIIVLDNISRKLKEGLGVFEACVNGVNEVMSALISSVLTTLAVFVPLVFLSGISGALFYDQAVAVAAVLGVSLLVAFVLLPMLYGLMFRMKNPSAQEDSQLFLKIQQGYEKLFDKIYQKKALYFSLALLLIPTGLLIGYFLPVAGLPPIEKHDAVIEVNWNEPIPLEQNKTRVIAMMGAIQQPFLQSEADLGLRQFLLFEGESSAQQASLYFLMASEKDKVNLLEEIKQYFQKHHPSAMLSIADAPNAFDQLFASNLPFYEIRLKDLKSKRPIPEHEIDIILSSFPLKSVEKGPGMQEEFAVVFKLDPSKLAVYGISAELAKEALLKLFGNYQITDIKKFGEITPIRLKSQTGNFEQVLNQNYLTGKKNEQYALSNFVSFEFVQQYKYITADQMGIYQSLNLEGKNPDEHRQDIKNWAKANNLGLEFFGQYFEDRARIQELTVILGFSVLILYFILAAQFESFVQPLIVIITLPLGVGGAFVFLALSGTSLNIMSAIGLVVMLGIMVNDAILKIDTINRLHLRYISVMPPDLALKNALKDAGEMRLKPILMTSLTTILALLPILFSEGLGADLQRPLVYSVLGGLSIGTLTALYFVPLAYYYLGKKAVKSLSEENLLEKSNT